MSTPLQEMVEQIEAGTLPISIGKTFKLDEIVEAHRTMEENKAGGKIVVLPWAIVSRHDGGIYFLHRDQDLICLEEASTYHSHVSYVQRSWCWLYDPGLVVGLSSVPTTRFGHELLWDRLIFNLERLAERLSQSTLYDACVDASPLFWEWRLDMAFVGAPKQARNCSAFWDLVSYSNLNHLCHFILGSLIK